jgi:hypothetical protein
MEDQNPEEDNIEPVERREEHLSPEPPRREEDTDLIVRLFLDEIFGNITDNAIDTIRRFDYVHMPIMGMIWDTDIMVTVVAKQARIYSTAPRGVGNILSKKLRDSLLGMLEEMAAASVGYYTREPSGFLWWVFDTENYRRIARAHGFSATEYEIWHHGAPSVGEQPMTRWNGKGLKEDK